MTIAVTVFPLFTCFRGALGSFLKFPRYAGHPYDLLLMLFHDPQQSCRNRHDGLPSLTSTWLDIILHCVQYEAATRRHLA
jgi:hypothetical protein